MEVIQNFFFKEGKKMSNSFSPSNKIHGWT